MPMRSHPESGQKEGKPVQRDSHADIPPDAAEPQPADDGHARPVALHDDTTWFLLRGGRRYKKKNA